MDNPDEITEYITQRDELYTSDEITVDNIWGTVDKYGKPFFLLLKDLPMENHLQIWRKDYSPLACEAARKTLLDDTGSTTLLELSFCLASIGPTVRRTSSVFIFPSIFVPFSTRFRGVVGDFERVSTLLFPC
jgi:hypothetical protein